MTGTNFSKIAAALALGTTVGLTAIPSTASAQSLSDLLKHKQKQKNDWRNLAIGGGALGVLGLFTHNSTLTYLGLGGGLYSAYRYEQDRKGQSKAQQQRAALFSKRSFNYNGKHYVRKTVWVNGKKHYKFVRA
jgi:H+/Cl- antiporter ClcA